MRFVRAGVVVVLLVAGWTAAPPGGAAGADPCRPTVARDVVPNALPAVGAGPVYALLLAEDPALFVRRGDDWGSHKVLWAGDASYAGIVRITGRRIGEPGLVRFGSGSEHLARRLHFSPDSYGHGFETSAPGWHDWPSSVRVRTSGCYELRVQTSEGVDRIVFRAEVRPQATAGTSAAGTSTGGKCPVEDAHAVAPLGPVVGSGPLYTSFGPRGRLEYGPGDAEGGWYRRKVAWLAEPGSTGTVQVRGRRVDGRGELRFGEGPAPAASLELPAESNSFLPGVSDQGWRFWPSLVRFRAPGCYRIEVRTGEPGTAQVFFFRAVPQP